MEVSIKNFRGIEDQTYSFFKGTNLLKGDSGAGKTTIFEAIKWCLYGNIKNILPWGSDKSKIKVQIKIDEYTITRTNSPATMVVLSKTSKYEGDEAKDKITRLFGTKSLWETCSYLNQDQRNFLLQASQKEKAEIIKELLFDMTSEESEWYKDKFERFKDELKLNNATISGKIDSLRDKLSIQDQNIDNSELKKAKKREQDLLLYDKINKKYIKLCDKIDEYEKFKEMKIENDKMEKKISLYPFEMSWKKFDKWQEYWRLREKQKILNKLETKENSFTQEEILIQLNIATTNYDILEKFGLNNDQQVQELYKHNMDIIKNKLVVEQNNKNKLKKKKLQKKLSELEEINKQLEKVRERKIFPEVKDEFNLPDDKKCSILISRFEELRDGKIRECPSCKQKLIIDGEGKLRISEIKNKSGAEKKIDILEWMMEIKQNYISTKREIEMIKREISEFSNLSELSEDSQTDYNQLEIDCKLLSKYTSGVCSFEDIQAMKNYIDLIEIKNRIDQIRFPGADYTFPVFPDNLGTTQEEYVEGYLEAKNTIKKYNQFKEQYQIIDEGEYRDKIEKRDKIKQELDKLDRVKDVLKSGEIVEYLREVSQNNHKINKSSVLADRIENLVNQNLQLFLIDFNNLINEMVSYLIEGISITLSLFKTTKVTKKTKCEVNVEINYKGHKIDNYSVLSGGQKDRLSLAFTLVFAKICNARFIFLDEFMSSLDENLRDKCLNLIKTLRNDGDLIIVNVCHETVEGCYDNVIEV